MTKTKKWYIITTARKRDTLEWEKECIHFLLSSNPEISVDGLGVVIDSWNNIAKYKSVKNSFFIFDEQRLVGNGTWVKSFLRISQANEWILLSATPGDTWIDYIPVMIANGFYKNRTEFLRRHVVYKNYSKFPKIDHYVEVGRLTKIIDAIVVKMRYTKRTESHEKYVPVSFDKDLFKSVMTTRWNIYKDEPIRDISELCYTLRRITNSDSSRIEALRQLFETHPKIIVFYNFNYERELLLSFGEEAGIPTAQWNGHKHELIPEEDSWLYIVQYAAGAEGWNCIETNAIVFYSQNYSYKAQTQAAGRIDRLNTPYDDLYYYHLVSTSQIDMAIKKALGEKKDFNEYCFLKM